MKIFTFLISMLFMATFTMAQSNDYMQNRIREIDLKLNQQTKTRNLFLKAQALTSATDVILKSAQPTLKIDSTVTREKNSLGNWVYEYKEEFSYNTLHQNYLWIEKEWSAGIEDWYIASRTDIQFNGQGNVSQMLNYYREEPGKNLNLEGKTIPEYDAPNRLKNLKNYSTENGTDWALEMEYIFTYNGSDQLTNITIWAEDEGEFIETMREAFIYNAGGKIEKIETYYLIEGTPLLFSESQMQYNGLGQLIGEEYKSLNYMTFTMEPSSKTTTSYNAAGDVDTEINYSWDKPGNAWVEDWKDQYIYGSADFSMIAWPDYYYLFSYLDGYQGITMNKAMTEIQTSTWVDGGWTDDERTNYYYSPIGSSYTDLIQNRKLTIYPNPAAESITLHWPGSESQLQMEVFQANGTKVHEQPIASGMTIPVSHLESGIYMVTLKKGKETIFQRNFVKR